MLFDGSAQCVAALEHRLGRKRVEKRSDRPLDGALFLGRRRGAPSAPDCVVLVVHVFFFERICIQEVSDPSKGRTDRAPLSASFGT